MKRGAKRPALFESAPDPVQPPFRSKRVMDATSFDVHRAESSRKHLVAGPPLDVQRAELSRLHVRALNTQFASWVQEQLQNHPDELWEDGVKDYLSHASHIMEKFKDIVDWLRANAAKSGTEPTESSPSDDNNTVGVSENTKPRTYSNINNGFAQASTPATFSSQAHTPTQSAFVQASKPATFSSFQTSGSLSSSQNAGFFSFTQTPAFPGNQSSNPPKGETSGDIDEDELEQPSSPSLKKTEEKGVVVVHEAKCKVYLKPDNPADKGWKDMGMGQLSIKCKEGADRATKESKPTIVIRNDVGKILLNALIYPGIKMNIQKNTIASIFHTLGGEGGESNTAVPRTYLLRLKSEEETTKLSDAIKEHAPST